MKTIKDYEYSFKHVQQRLIERHGLNITMDEYDKLNVVVVRALYTRGMIGTKYQRQEVIPVIIHSKTVKVTFDTHHGRVTTVLP